MPGCPGPLPTELQNPESAEGKARPGPGPGDVLKDSSYPARSPSLWSKSLHFSLTRRSGAGLMREIDGDELTHCGRACGAGSGLS